MQDNHLKITSLEIRNLWNVLSFDFQKTHCNNLEHVMSKFNNANVLLYIWDAGRDGP